MCEQFISRSGLFFTAWGRCPCAISLGKIASFFLLRGMKKPDVKLLFGEKCMIVTKFSEGKVPINGPCYRRKKSPADQLAHLYHLVWINSDNVLIRNNLKRT
jgi:hypothetical protein